MLTASKLINDFKKRFDPRLRRVLEEESRKAGKVSPTLLSLFSAMRKYALSGGKRIRPFLFTLSYQGLGGRNLRVIDLSVFTELVHLELLALDDIMDQSDFRHNVPTIHVKEEKNFFEKYQRKGQLGNFGESAGILAGLIFGHLAFELLAESKFEEKIILNLNAFYNRRIIETAYGQYFDLENVARRDAGENEVTLTNLYKTAKYTIEGPMLAGAILAGAKKGEIQKISRFGINLGLGFQLTDDLVELFGDEAKLGKPVALDLANGKRTLLTLKALELVPKKMRREFKKIIRQRKFNKVDLERYRQILRESGAKEYVENLAEKNILDALEELEKITYSKIVKEKLKLIADYFLRRTF